MAPSKSTYSNYREVLSNIRNGNFAPIYLLMGDEDYYIDLLVEALEKNVVEEEDRDFNMETFYGADTDVRNVVSRAQQYPVMAPRQIVLLKEAQALFHAKTQLENLVPYAEHPSQTTVLVITYKGDSLAAASSLAKAIKAGGGVIVKSDRPKDYQLAGPIGEYCREIGVGIDDKGIYLLGEYIGTPLSKLFGEIDKLAVAAGSSKRITGELIEAVTGISKEFNTWELTQAIAEKNYPKAMRILDYFSKSPKQNPGIVIIATLFNYFSKLFVVSVMKDKSDAALMEALDLKTSFSLGNYKTGLRNFRAAAIDSIIHEIRAVDAKSKGIGSTRDEYDLLTELVFRIFTVR